MNFYNANVFDSEYGFKKGSFEVKDGIFTEVCFDNNIKTSGMDLNGAMLFLV